MSNKIRKYLLYTLGEIILVVAGILIALQINNLNEERKLIKVSDETRRDLISELEDTRKILNEVLTSNERITNMSRLYLEGDFPRDSFSRNPGIIFTFTNYTPIQLELPVVSREISADRKIINDPALHDLIRKISFRSKSVEINLSYLDEFWNSEALPYLIKTRNAVLFYKSFHENGLEPGEVSDIIGDEEWKNVVAASILLTLSYSEVVELMILDIDKVLLYLGEPQ